MVSAFCLIPVSPLLFARTVFPDAVPGCEEPVLPCRARVLSLGHPPGVFARRDVLVMLLCRELRASQELTASVSCNNSMCASYLDFAYWGNFLYLYAGTY